MRTCSLSSFFVCIVLVSLFSASGYAQEDSALYPSGPITFVTPIAANSSTDTAIRMLCREAEKLLGQPITVVNKVGVSTTIGTGFLAASKPDGYTIGYVAHSGFFVVPLLQKVSYRPLQDLTPILHGEG